MTPKFNNLSALAAAAARAGCTVHMHLDEGQTVFSVGNGDIGAAEFSSYALALDWATNRADGDCAEISGGAIASDLLNDLLAARNQCRTVVLIQAAIVKLATLQHHDRAADGFAVGIVNVLEVGLKNLPKVTA